MEWKLECIVLWWVWIEEEMLWVSNVFWFFCFNFLEGFFIEGIVCNICLGLKGSIKF